MCGGMKAKGCISHGSREFLSMTLCIQFVAKILQVLFKALPKTPLAESF